MKIFWLSLLLLTGLIGTAQVAINTDGSPPDSSAILDLQSTEKGLLIPRMTFVQRNAIEDPVEGLMVICTNCSRQGKVILSVYQAGKWMNYAVECQPPPSAPLQIHDEAQAHQITWKWHSVCRANGYKLSNSNDFESALDFGLDTSYTETGLECRTEYLKYIWSYNDCGPSHFGQLIENTTFETFISPEADNHIPNYYSITWKWLPVPGATCYSWNTINEPGTIVFDLLSTEYGLYCNHTDTAYVWAYGQCGISESSMLIQATNSCPADCLPFTDSRNNKFYNTVLINDQCWMRENLDIGSRINGQVEQIDNNTIEKYCYYNQDLNCAIYGGLYQWDEMMQYSDTEGSQGICPAGWHLPSDEEWQSLVNYLGGAGVAGSKLKEAGTTHWLQTNNETQNESAFTAIAGGLRYPVVGSYANLGWTGTFWTSTPDSEPQNAHTRTIRTYDNEVETYEQFQKDWGFSVRCIKD